MHYELPSTKNIFALRFKRQSHLPHSALKTGRMFCHELQLLGGGGIVLLFFFLLKGKDHFKDSRWWQSYRCKGHLLLSYTVFAGLEDCVEQSSFDCNSQQFWWAAAKLSEQSQKPVQNLIKKRHLWDLIVLYSTDCCSWRGGKLVRTDYIQDFDSSTAD